MKIFYIVILVSTLVLSCSTSPVNAKFSGVYQPQMDLFKGMLSCEECMANKIDRRVVDPGGDSYFELTTEEFGRVYIRYQPNTEWEFEVGTLLGSSIFGGGGRSLIFYDNDADGKLESFRVNGHGPMRADAGWQDEYARVLSAIFLQLECQGLW